MGDPLMTEDAAGTLRMMQVFFTDLYFSKRPARLKLMRDTMYDEHDVGDDRCFLDLQSV